MATLRAAIGRRARSAPVGSISWRSVVGAVGRRRRRRSALRRRRAHAHVARAIESARDSKPWMASPRPKARRCRASMAARGIGGQMIWATRFLEAGRCRLQPQLEQQRQGRRRPRRRPRQCDAIPISPISRSACAKGRSLRAARLGRRQGARPDDAADPRLSRRRGRRLADPLIVAKEGAESAGLSRARLCRVRAAAARRFRQPHSAIIVRDRAAGRRARRDDPRRDTDPRRDRSSATSRRCKLQLLDAGVSTRRRTAISCTAPTDWSRLARRAAGALPQSRERRAGGGLVRRRSARRRSARSRRASTRRFKTIGEFDYIIGAPGRRTGRSRDCRARPRGSCRRSTDARPMAARRATRRARGHRRTEGARAQGRRSIRS